MLELQHIHKMYNPGTINEICLFDDFNLTIEDGQFVSVVGSNGSGKTSMLNIICGSIPVDGGKIMVNGVDITKKKDFMRHQYWTGISGPIEGHLPVHDDSGESGYSRQ